MVVPSREKGGPGRGKKGAVAQRAVLPDADPGQDVADRWRKRFCVKTEAGTVMDEKMRRAKARSPVFYS